MLVLSRKPNEAIIIGTDGKTRVTVLAINGYQVKVGIEAPREVAVHREEIFLRIQNVLTDASLTDKVTNITQAANNDNIK